MSSIQGNVLAFEKAILLCPDGAKNIMDILDYDPSPTECMVIFFFLGIPLEMFVLWISHLNSYLFLTLFFEFREKVEI